MRDANALFTQEDKFTTWGSAIVTCGVVRLIWSVREQKREFGDSAIYLPYTPLIARSPYAL